MILVQPGRKSSSEKKKNNSGTTNMTKRNGAKPGAERHSKKRCSD